MSMEKITVLGKRTSRHYSSFVFFGPMQCQAVGRKPLQPDSLVRGAPASNLLLMPQSSPISSVMLSKLKIFYINFVVNYNFSA